MGIGLFELVDNLSEEYQNIARHDEHVAAALMSLGEYRHAAYFLIQAIEKYLRSKIFSIVDGRQAYYREQNRNHSVEEAADFLVQVMSTDTRVQEHIRSQLNQYVLSGVQFHHLHNNIRYPRYVERQNHFVSLKVSKEDVESIRARLLWVKNFINAI